MPSLSFKSSTLEACESKGVGGGGISMLNTNYLNLDANNNASKCRASNGGGGLVYWTFTDPTRMFDLTDGELPFDHTLFKEGLGVGPEHINTALYGDIFASSPSRLFLQKGPTVEGDLQNNIQLFNIKTDANPTTENVVTILSSAITDAVDSGKVFENNIIEVLVLDCTY